MLFEANKLIVNNPSDVRPTTKPSGHLPSVDWAT